MTSRYVEPSSEWMEADRRLALASITSCSIASYWTPSLRGRYFSHTLLIRKHLFLKDASDMTHE